MRITLVGPGRAGLSVALAAVAGGHSIVAVVGRTSSSAASGAARFGAVPLVPGDPLPAADLLVIATRDGVIGMVASTLAPTAGSTVAAVHLSGLAPVSVLAPLAAAGLATGAFHPLQTLPEPSIGAERLPGAWVAVTADEPLRAALHELADSIGARPFDLADAAKPAYHAAAAAAANFPLASLIIAADLFESVGVPFAVARPLVDAAIDNAFTMGPRAALTGPVVRGDVGTVDAQLRAVASATPEWVPAYSRMVAILAELAGRSGEFAEVLGADHGERDAQR
jgi:predicted short-subunit dehydrogenase-like oxidoreductase (DUF2520 family)